MSKGIALETIELGNRPDQNKKEGSNQKSQFGMKGEKSLLRLGQNDGQSAEEFGGFVEFGGVYEAQHRLQQNSECHQQPDIGNASEREDAIRHKGDDEESADESKNEGWRHDASEQSNG
jgi:hypothetical protein